MHEADAIIEAAVENLPSYDKEPRDIATVGYKGRVSILKQDYPAVMREAVNLRRKGVALSRAEAVEDAFDLLLRKAAPEWERTGEVHLDREANRARAFCSSGGGVPQLIGGGGEDTPGDEVNV